MATNGVRLVLMVPQQHTDSNGDAMLSTQTHFYTFKKKKKNVY